MQELKLIALLIILFIHGSAYTQETNPPNIIFILTDDQRWDALGYADNNIIQTPQMDLLAQEGVYFSNAFVTTPICAASRASVITGLYERTHNFTFRTPPLQQRHSDLSYPKLLRDAGYRTGLFGKMGMTFENNADTSIFDQVYNTSTGGYFRLIGEGSREHEHLTDHTTNRAIDFIKETPKDQPFCLSISYNAAHADDAHPQQYFWPERNNQLYKDVEIPKGELHTSKWHDQLPDILKDSLYLGNARYKWRYDTPEKYQQMVKGYYRLLSTIDDNIGRLRKTLELLNIDQNTIIILMGDNGYFLAERGLAGKWLMYENSIRVPLIVYDPKAERKIQTDKMALNIDIAPTILDYAGIAIPSSMQGVSLKPFGYEKVNQWRTEFVCEHLFEHPYIPKSEGIRTEKWKYFRYLDRPDIEELYNLEQDEMELNNLASNPIYATQVKEFRDKLISKTTALESK